VRQLDDLRDEQLLRRLQQVTELAGPRLAGNVIDITVQEREKSSE
jgi:hypothetical protein